MVVGPQRRVAERLAAPRQLARDVLVEAGRDPQAAGAVSHRASLALEQRHALDVGGVGEHVDGRGP